MPELSPAQAESHTTPSELGKQGGLRSDPYPDIHLRNMELIRTPDHDLKELQRHNERIQFLNYEQRVRAAYAQSQNPKLTGRSNPSARRGVQGNSKLNAPS